MLLLFLFAGTCTALLPGAAKLVDPLTHRRMKPGEPFQVIVMRGEVPELTLVTNADRLSPPPRGTSYLVPAGKVREIENVLNAQRPASGEGAWSVKVRPLPGDRQLIEVTWISDGYSGAGYEASATSLKPRYRKQTGPAFALIFGGVALLTNIAVWSAFAGGMRWWRHRSRP